MALYYGIKMCADKVISGAPQYYIGSYLNTEDHRKILEGIMGRCDKEAVTILNSVIVDCVKDCLGSKPTICLHFSLKEHTYKEHIEFMIKDLEENGYIVKKDINHTYENHSDVALYFPQYLLKEIDEACSY